MKIRNNIGTVFVLVWVVLFALTACSSIVSAQGGPTTGAGLGPRSGEGLGLGNGVRGGGQSGWNANRGIGEPILVETPAGELSEAEEEGLLYMREEEKLARDVYLALYEQWGVQTFTNVAGSENTHMEAVKTLLDRYGLSDPVEGKQAGEFVNEDLQALYDQLVDQGSRSLVDALKVGAAIEEIDILDLKEYLTQTDKADIQRVYDSLMRGSQNHLRAFIAGLERQGVEYKPEYLSPEAYDQILAAGTGRGSGSGSQGGQGGRGRQGGR